MDTIKRNLWWIYGVLFVVYAVWAFKEVGTHAYAVNPEIGKSHRIAAREVLAWSSTAATGLGILMWKPARPLPWVLIFIAHASYSVGVTMEFPGYTPSIRDFFFLAFIPYYCAGVVLFIYQRDRVRDRIGFIDSLIIGMGLFSLMFLESLNGALMEPGRPFWDKVTQTAYVVGTLGILIAAIRLLLTAGTKRGSYYVFVVATIFLAIVQFCSFLPAAEWGSVFATLTLEAPIFIFYVLSAGVALHPSMSTLGDPGDLKRVLWTSIPRRTLIIGCALIPVILTVYQENQIVNWMAAGAVILLVLRFQLIVNGLRRTQNTVREAGLEIEKQHKLRTQRRLNMKPDSGLRRRINDFWHHN